MKSDHYIVLTSRLGGYGEGIDINHLNRALVLAAGNRVGVVFAEDVERLAEMQDAEEIDWLSHYRSHDHSHWGYDYWAAWLKEKVAPRATMEATV